MPGSGTVNPLVGETLTSSASAKSEQVPVKFAAPGVKVTGEDFRSNSQPGKSEEDMEGSNQWRGTVFVEAHASRFSRSHREHHHSFASPRWPSRDLWSLRCPLREWSRESSPRRLRRESAVFFLGHRGALVFLNRKTATGSKIHFRSRESRLRFQESTVGTT